MFLFCQESRDSNKDQRDMGGLPCRRRERGGGGCDRTWSCGKKRCLERLWRKCWFGPSPSLSSAIQVIVGLPRHRCCSTSYRSVRMSACTEGVDVMGSRPRADVCSHDLSAAVGTVGIPRERPRVREVRTVEHLEHHDRALLELKPDAHGAETTYLTRDPRTAHPVCLNALRIIPTCRARCSSCNVNVGWRVRAQERMAKSSKAAAPRCLTLFSAF